MVCLPGYGAGAGFYWKNLEALGRLRKVYAVDPLGTGLSSRPSFSATNVHEAEEFFIGALEQWHKAMGLEQMVSPSLSRAAS